MSALSSRVATSRKNTGCSPNFTGMRPSSSSGLAPTIALVFTRKLRSPSRRFPAGTTLLPCVTTSVTWSSVTCCARSFSGSTLTTMARWLPPNAGGLVTPGMLANMGRILMLAWSCTSLMASVSLLRIR